MCLSHMAFYRVTKYCHWFWEVPYIAFSPSFSELGRGFVPQFPFFYIIVFWQEHYIHPASLVCAHRWEQAPNTSACPRLIPNGNAFSHIVWNLQLWRPDACQHQHQHALCPSPSRCTASTDRVAWRVSRSREVISLPPKVGIPEQKFRNWWLIISFLKQVAMDWGTALWYWLRLVSILCCKIL